MNYVFIEHFQEIAQGHFTVRRLERVYGKDIVRAEYERLAQATEVQLSPLLDLEVGLAMCTDGWPTLTRMWRATHRLENKNEASS